MTTMQDRILERVTAARNNPGFRNLVREKTLPPEYREIASIKASIEDELLERPSVRGVAIGASDQSGQTQMRPVIVVFLEEDSDKQRGLAKDAFRAALDRQQLANDGGDRALAELDFVETGRIFFRRRRLPLRWQILLSTMIIKPVRPIVGGYPGGRMRSGSGRGTFGICCYGNDSLSELVYMLSNNHVLANVNECSVGDTIVQYGPTMGKYPVGSLAGFVPIEFAQKDSAQESPVAVNYVEAAIAKRYADTDLDGKIDKIGVPQDCEYAPKLDTEVQKVGASTGLTCGAITHVDATVKIDFRNVGEARFCHQIVTDKIGDDGDSGSLLVSKQGNRPIGLMFAENNEHGQIYANSILLVEAFLGIRITPNGAPLPNLGLTP